jgi:chromosome segregation protein
MSFYIFDEIDTALDKQNSKKLSALIKQLSSNSQFIVVSHNDTLISYADTAIGVAKNKGESNIFGVKIVAPESVEIK